MELFRSGANFSNWTAESGEGNTEQYDDLVLPDYDSSWVEDSPDDNFFANVIKLLQKPQVMGAIEDMLAASSKFIRVMDDLHDMRNYLNDMRICFIALTISGYVGIVIYALLICIKKQRARRRRGRRMMSSRFPDEESGTSPEWDMNYMEGRGNGPFNKYGYRHKIPGGNVAGSMTDGGVVRQPMLLVGNDQHRGAHHHLVQPPLTKEDLEKKNNV